MNPLQWLYASFHRAATPDHERSSCVSPGYWNHRVRDAVLAQVHGFRGKVLDVGCGDGLFLERLAQQNPQAAIWAVDIDANSIRLARQRLELVSGVSIHFSQQDATMLDFDAHTFDLVICTNVFMTMDSMATVRKALICVSRVCKKDAMLFFDYRNGDNPLLRLKYRLAPLYDATIKGRQVSAYAPREMEDALRKAGLDTVETYYHGLLGSRAWAPVIIVKARKTYDR